MLKLRKYYKIIPLILVLAGGVFEQYALNISNSFKIVAIFSLFFIIKFKRTSVYLYILIALGAYIFFLLIYNKIPFDQGIEDGFRYFIPILALAYGQSLKDQTKITISTLLFFVIVNNIYQLLQYLLTPIFLGTFDFSIYRATGLVGFFDFFGFINLIALVILIEFDVKKTIFKKYIKVLPFFFFLFMLWSLSLKILIIGIIYITIRKRVILTVIVFLIPLLYLYYNKLVSAIELRIDRYILNIKSARLEAYKLVKVNIKDFWFLGKGPGTFGGPASTKYKSDLYNVYNFHWHGEETMSTVDAYYPHLIIELGLIMSAFYLLAIILTPYLEKNKSSLVITILLILLTNSIFTFALNSINYCFTSLILIYLVDIRFRNNE